MHRRHGPLHRRAPIALVSCSLLRASLYQLPPSPLLQIKTRHSANKGNRGTGAPIQGRAFWIEELMSPSGKLLLATSHLLSSARGGRQGGATLSLQCMLVCSRLMSPQPTNKLPTKRAIASVQSDGHWVPHYLWCS